MAYNDTLTNKSSKTIVNTYVKSPTGKSLVSTTSSNSSSSSINSHVIDIFSGDNARGTIKISGTDVTPTTLWAYDVTVEKELPLLSQQNVSNSTTSTTTASTESHIILKFKFDVTPSDMTVSAFVDKRNDFLFDYEDKIVTVTSNMFDTISQAQFTDISYEIPAGQETTIYTVAMIEVTATESTNATATTSTTSSTSTTNTATSLD